MTTVTDTSQFSTLSKRGARGAFVAALALALSGLTQLVLVYPTPGPGEIGTTSAYLIESAHVIAWIGMILAFMGLRALHGQRFGRLGNLSFFLASVSNILLALITTGVLITTFSVGTEAAASVFAPGTTGELIANVFALPGFLTMIVWIPLLGIASWRANVAPRWCAVLLIAHPLFFFSLLASYGFGGLALGALWLFVGLGIRAHYQRQHLINTFGHQQPV
jgi:hypothetical protein